MKASLALLNFIIFFTFSFPGQAQLKPVFEFQQDDTLLRKSYYDQALAQHKKIIASLGKEYHNDYRELYESRFNSIGALLSSTRTVTAPEAHGYLQSILKKIIDGNPELKNREIRMVFSRDWWPNAFSMGDGTIAINAGLLVFLDNEAELVFAICHELAHYYLDHSNRAIKKNIETINSEEYKNEFRRISKAEFRIVEQLEKLVRKFAYGSLRHSRDYETEADRQGFNFMKNTGYSCASIRDCFRILDKVDDSSVYAPLVLENIFNFPDYPFRKKWVQKESVIFGAMNTDESPLTPQERDSLKTHPDCAKRMELLSGAVDSAGTGKDFLVNRDLFNHLKKEFEVEMTEQEFREESLSRNLYYSLQMIQQGENIPFAVYSVARALNLIYTNQKQHRLGMVTDKESRTYRADYNLLLRMIDRIRLDELAELNYYFCRHYESRMQGYAGFADELQKAELNRSLYKN